MTIRERTFDVVASTLFGTASVLFLLSICTAQPEVDQPDLEAPPPTEKAPDIPAADPTSLGIYAPCKVIRVLDGDTMDVEVRAVVRIRLLDCWAPEIHGPQKNAGLRAKSAMVKMAEGKAATVIIPFRESLTNMLTLNRVLGRIIVNGNDVAKSQVRNGLAGETKEREAELFPINE